MPNTILIKKSSTAAATPTAGQLAAGELAINTADGKLFAKNAAGTVVNLPVTSISGQTITPDKVTAASIGVGTANPQTNLQIVSGYDYDGGNDVVTPVTGELYGTAQTEIFQVISGGHTVDNNGETPHVNIARFHVNGPSSRGSLSLSNSGAPDGTVSSGAWENNVLQFFVHGPNYAYGYYGGNASDAGCAMIVTQGSDIQKLQIGNIGAAPIEFFTSNATRMRISATGDVSVGTTATSGRLTVKGTTTPTAAALQVTNSADASLFFVRNDGRAGINGAAVQASLTIKSHGNTASTSALRVVDSGNSVLLGVRDDGNVGIGAEPANAKRLLVTGAGTTSATSALDVTNSDNTSLFFVRNDGRVGINYTAPDAVLVVKGKSNVVPHAAFKVLNSTDSTLLYVGDDGRVGISKSTLPTATLDVEGDIAAEQVNAEQVNIGTSNVLDAAATYGSIIGGLQSKASMYGEIAHASGGFVSTEGTAQHRILVARGLTLSGAFTVSIGVPAVFTRNGHSLSAGDTVKFSTTGALPTGLNTTTNYFVSSAGLTANTFQVSTTRTGASVVTSGTQSGTHTLIPSTSLTLNGAVGLVTPARLVIPERSTWSFTLKLSAYSSQNNQGGAWWLNGGLRRSLSATTELENTQGFQYAENSFGASGALIDVAADTINNALDIRVTGIANQSVRWAAVIDIIQVSFGTP